MTLTGKVLSVETRNLGEPATAAATIGAFTVYVNDAATFDENGGFVTVGGEQLAYSSIDADLDSITLTSALTVAIEEQDLIEVYPPTPEKVALVSLGGDGDPIPATVPHSLLDKFPDGTRSDDQAESVTFEQRGTYEFIVTDAIAEPLTQQSLDYVEGEEGYGLDEAGVQVKDMQATGQIGAAVVSADQVIIGGTDLVDTLAPVPKSTKYATRGAPGAINAGTTSASTELRLFTFNAGPVKAGRLYYVTVRGLGQGTVAGDSFYIRTKYTTDGSEPTTASPLLTGGQSLTVIANVLRSQVDSAAWYAPTADGELRLSISAQRTGGTGTFLMRTDAPEVAVQVAVSDMGIDSDSSTALQQTAKTDGSGSDNPPETTKVLSWQPTHTEYYMGFAGRTGAADQTDIGVAPIGWQQDLLRITNDRPDFSVLHFNHADIVSKLATASSIEKVELRFKVKTRAAAAGLDLSVFAHKYATFPHSMAGDYVTETAAARIVAGQGSKNDAAPGSTYTITLNTAVGTNLKSGLYKGIGVTTTVYTTAGVGELYGNPSVDRPTLIITFKSPA